MANNKKSKKPERTQEVLGDHERVGKRFIPPFVSKLSGLQEVSYVQRLLPEIIWIGLVNDALGYREGTQLCTSLARTTKKDLGSGMRIDLMATCEPEKRGSQNFHN